MATTWQNHGKKHGENMAKPWQKTWRNNMAKQHGKNMAKHGQHMAKTWQNNMAKAWQKHGNHSKTWQTHGKTMTKHGKHIQNGTDRAGRGGTCQERGAAEPAQGLLFPPQATEVLGNHDSRDRDGDGHSLIAAAPGPAMAQRPRRSRTGPAVAQRPNPVANSRRRRSFACLFFCGWGFYKGRRGRGF